MTPEMTQQETLQAVYARLETLREPFLMRARAASAITIPALLPPKGHAPSSPLPTPYQSLGARGVNNLAAKLLLTLFPPNQPFFKYSMSEDAREQLGAQVGDVEKALSKAERIVVRDIETSHFRPNAFVALKHLLVAGNVLTHDDEKTRALRVFAMTQYVTQRDPAGNMLQTVVKECVSPEVLPPAVKEMALRWQQEQGKTSEKTVDLFTGIKRVGSRYEIHQEVCGHRIEGSEGHYPVDACPWNAMRLIIVENEDYGRGYVEEYYGDLMSLEVLQKAMVLGSAAAAKIVFMVKPNGSTDEDDLTQAEAGDVITGDADDVEALSIDKRADFTTVETRIQKLREDLAYAFLLNSAIQRKGERVTAEEIRYMANELESALGGIYSSLSQEFQLPVVRARSTSLTRRGKLPNLPKEVVEPMITTGVDAIGRGNDFEKLRAYVGFLAETLGPQVVQQRLHSGELAKRAAAAMGIEDDGLVKSDDEVNQEQEQMHSMQMQQNAVAPMINQAGQMAQAQQAAQ